MCRVHTIRKFNGGEVTVEIPWQKYEVEINSLPLDLSEVPPERLSAAGGPLRLVINLRVRDAATKDLVLDFNPPIKLTVEWTKKNGKTLWYWEGREGVWIPFDKWLRKEGQNEFYVDDQKKLGIATVYHWGDVEIAAGPM